MFFHFTQVLVGLVCIFVHIKINDFDLLFDPLGHLLLAVGCGGLATLSKSFSNASYLAIVAMGLWFAGLAIDGDPTTIKMHSAATSVVNCILIWQILGGIAEYSATQQRQDLVDKANNRRLGYVALVIGSELVTPILPGSLASVPTVTLLAIATLLAALFVIHMVYHARQELAP